MKIIKNKVIIFFILLCMLNLYRCASEVYCRYVPLKIEKSFINIIGDKENNGKLNLIISFYNDDSIHSITKMQVYIKYDNITLIPKEFKPPYFDINAEKFDDLPLESKFSKVYSYNQFVVSFYFKKNEQPKDIEVNIQLEGENQRKEKVHYNINRKLKFKKTRRYLSI